MSKVVKSVGRGIFGGGGSAGALGTGRRQVERVEIDPEAFKRRISEDAEQQQSRKIQAELSAALQARARGEGESVAERQLRASSDRLLAQQRGAAAGAKGRSGALAQRSLQRQAAEQGQELARQSGTLRAEEQLAAQQTLAQQIAQQRAQDIGVSEQDRASAQALQQLRVQEAQGFNQASQQAFEGAAQRRGKLVENVGKGITAFASDKNLKKDIKSSDKDVQGFLDALQAKKFKFKDERNGDEDELGILAQDMEKSEMGENIVEETEEGKGISVSKGFGAILAAQAQLNDRLKKIEKMRSKKDKK